MINRTILAAVFAGFLAAFIGPQASQAANESLAANEYVAAVSVSSGVYDQLAVFVLEVGSDGVCRVYHTQNWEDEVEGIRGLDATLIDDKFNPDQYHEMVLNEELPLSSEHGRHAVNLTCTSKGVLVNNSN